MVSSTILGPDGEPIALPDLAEPQTAQLASLRHEWAGHPSRGLTPSQLAGIMDAAELGDIVAQCDLFEDMEEKDGHIASEMGKRRRAVTQLDWSIVPPPNPSAAEKRNAAQVEEWLRDLTCLDDAQFDLTDAIGKAFSCLEIEWHRLGSAWLPRTLTHRPQSWFRFMRGYTEEIRLRDIGSSDGVALQPFGWIVHVHKAKSGYLPRAALFRVLAWPYLFKNYSVGDLAEFLEIYGLPIRVGKYPPGTGEKEKMTLLRALVSLGHKAAGIIPQGMEIAFEDATTGEPRAYEAMIEWCERTQSKAILGGTLTSQADGKSSTHALGKVHDEVRKDLRDADVKQINATWRRDLVYAVAAVNGLAPDGPARAPRWQYAIQENTDISAFASALPPLVAMGMRIERGWAQEKLGIPEPEPDDTDLLRPLPAQDAAKLPSQDAPAAGGAGLAAASAIAPPSAVTPPDPASQQADLLGRRAAPALDAWVGQIRELAAKAGSLQELRDGLLALAPHMSLDDYSRAMTEALTAAALAGRFEVLQEAAS